MCIFGLPVCHLGNQRTIVPAATVNRHASKAVGALQVIWNR